MKKYKDGLYHKDVYFPVLNLVNRDVEVGHTYHAIESAKNDRYDIIKLPKYINPSLGEPIEVEIKNNCMVKIIIRFHYNSEYDLTMAIALDTMCIKTAWLNEKNDYHTTLNRSRYVQRPVN